MVQSPPEESPLHLEAEDDVQLVRRARTPLQESDPPIEAPHQDGTSPRTSSSTGAR